MSLPIKELQALKDRIAATWSLLKLDAQLEKILQLETDMQASDFWDTPEQAARIAKEYEELKKEYDIWDQLKKEVDELLLLTADLEKNPDESMEIELKKQVVLLEQKFEKLEFFILLSEEHDTNNAIIAFHAGSGGTEAQDWAQMLMRMIMRYAERKDWNVTVLDVSEGAEAGIKSATIKVAGRFAYGYLQSEHGTHRLVRISPFDAEKMRHTSFANIEVIPEIVHDDAIEIHPKDLRIDTFMAGGNGGQSVNTTYSAVRIVHIPTGITVQCQNERSQLQNKETALKILKSKLLKKQKEEQDAEKLKLRGEYKSAEWGNQIRSYVLHPYKMVKDLRTRYETTDTEAVLDGDLDSLTEAYLRWRKNSDQA